MDTKTINRTLEHFINFLLIPALLFFLILPFFAGKNKAENLPLQLPRMHFFSHQTWFLTSSHITHRWFLQFCIVMRGRSGVIIGYNSFTIFLVSVYFYFLKFLFLQIHTFSFASSFFIIQSGYPNQNDIKILYWSQNPKMDRIITS